MGSPMSMPRRPPPDRIAVDDELPAGTIAVEILDADEQPLPNVALTLDVLQRSVARGDSSEQQTATANEEGQFRFTDLEFGRGISYRVTAHRGAARFASEPFGLSNKHGVRVQLRRGDNLQDLAASINELSIAQDERLWQEVQILEDLAEQAKRISSREDAMRIVEALEDQVAERRLAAGFPAPESREA